MLGAIILAAGESSRMGRPKALLTYRGRTFLEGILEASYAVGCERRVVVLGHHADKILEHIDLSDVHVVRSEALAAGPIGSVRAGIRSLVNHPVEAAFLWPVDRPHVLVTTVQALADGFRQTGRAIVVPRVGERRGHPVLFARAVFQELLEVPETEGARAVVRRDRERVLEVPVEDPAVLEDLNTPGQYQDLMRRSDSHLGGER